MRDDGREKEGLIRLGVSQAVPALFRIWHTTLVDLDFPFYGCFGIRKLINRILWVDTDIDWY